jgi:hypothetical protein
MVSPYAINLWHYIWQRAYFQGRPVSWGRTDLTGQASGIPVWPIAKRFAFSEAQVNALVQWECCRSGQRIRAKRGPLAPSNDERAYSEN